MAGKKSPKSDEQRRKEAKDRIEERSRKIVGTDSTERAMHLTDQVFQTTPALIRNGANSLQAMGSVLDSIAKLAPRDETERMLVGQMISVHEQAMESFRRASLPNQTFEGRDMNLKHAEKLVGLYARQMEALDKHRGKGKQKITVEHVNVHAGGQAIVGDVHAAQGKKAAPADRAKAETPAALTDQSEADAEGRQIMDELKKAKAPARKAKKS